MINIQKRKIKLNTKLNDNTTPDSRCVPSFDEQNEESKANLEYLKRYYKWAIDIIDSLIKSIQYNLENGGRFSILVARFLGFLLEQFIKLINILINGEFIKIILIFIITCTIIIGVIFLHIFIFLCAYYQNVDKASDEFRKLMKGMDSTNGNTTSGNSTVNKKLPPLLTNSYMPDFSFSKLLTTLYIQIGFNNILNEDELECRTQYTNDMGQCDDINHISGKYIKGGKLSSCYNLKKPEQINWKINEYLAKFNSEEPSHFELIKNAGKFKDNYDNSHYNKTNNEFTNEYKFNDINIKWIIKDNIYKLDCDKFFYNNNKQSFASGLKCANK